MYKPTLGVFYWHNPTRLGNLELVDRLRQDFRILIVSNQKVPYLHRYGDHVISEHFGNTDQIQQQLQSWKKRQGLDGMITLSEGAVTLLADVTSDLGLEGNEPQASRAGRNKYLMRKRMQQANIPQPLFYKAHSLEEAVDITTQEFGDAPYFLKPPCIGGSSFCSKVQDKQQLREIWQPFFEGSKQRTRKDPLFTEHFGIDGADYYLIIEELMGGTQFPYDDVLGPRFPVFEMSVEGFISGNNTYVYSMTDKLLPAGCTNGEEYMWRMHSRVPPALKEILTNRVTQINRALDATSGCSHTEFRVEECAATEADIELTGKHYRARMIETALRPGGAFMQPAIAMATGFNAIRAMAYQACRMPHEEEVLYRHPMIMANLWADSPGRMIAIQGLDKIMSLRQDLAAFHLYDSIGDQIQVPPEASRGIGDAIILGESINLLQTPDWETSRGHDSPYRTAEEKYLQVIDNLRVITK